MSGDRITIADTRAAGFCWSGVKLRLAAAGYDPKDFARNGIPVEEARKVDGWEALIKHIEKIKDLRRGQEI